MNNPDISKILPCLSEKFIVDFVNGIDVEKGQIQFRRSRTGFFQRMYDSSTGKGKKLQDEINKNLAEGAESTLIWLTDLTKSLAQVNHALFKVNDRIIIIQDNIVTLTVYSEETRRQLEKLSSVFDERCQILDAEISWLAAKMQLKEVVEKWERSGYKMFSLAGQLYAVLEELRWGAFGNYCRRFYEHHGWQNLVEELTREAIRRLSKELNLSDHELPVARLWLSPPPEAIPEAKEALAYLGDWSQPEHHPFVYSTTQVPNELPERLPLLMPRFCEPDRVARALISEVLEKS
jgi:hypothetical protein